MLVMKPVRNILTKKDLFDNMSFDIKTRYKGTHKPPFVNYKGDLIYKNRVIQRFECNKFKFDEQLSKDLIEQHNKNNRHELVSSSTVYFTFDSFNGTVKMWSKLSGERINIFLL